MVKYTKPVQLKFSALSEPTRFAVLERLLTEGELPLTSLFKPYESTMSLPGLLKHVRILEEAELIESEKIGRERLYSPHRKGIKEFSTWLQESKLFWNDALDRLKTHVESE